MAADYLHSLNEAQLRAVQHPPDVPLQIIAGPGSGKTKALTSRIAYLISHHSITPESICAVTFTNKAAHEMRERLNILIGKHLTKQIRMGTFHALCAMFLRRYAVLVGVDGNFTICDADESKKIIKKLLEPHKQALAAKSISLKEETIMSKISRAKARGLSADDIKSGKPSKLTGTVDNDTDDVVIAGETSIGAQIRAVVVDIYKEYEVTLRESNSLDFDDLLMFGVKLFSEHRAVGRWCRHILVDEFQDTNSIQYELMKQIAATSKCVTIVGDPDQSIYGWRSAEAENLHKMRMDFPGTQQVFLEQNYRSTASILAASVAIVSQDKNRVPKILRTSCGAGPTPVLRVSPTEHLEAAFIASEIKRLVAYSGGMLGWGDFAILLRYNAFSRLLENALQREGIPNRVLKGHKFFERMEVKDILAYLQLVDNPNFVPAFTRIINVPSRNIGEKTVNEILKTAERLKLSPPEVIERIFDGQLQDIKPPIKRKLAQFVPAIRKLRASSRKGESAPDLIRHLLAIVDYEGHLNKTQPDWENRWENVQELINFASEVDVDVSDLGPDATIITNLRSDNEDDDEVVMLKDDTLAEFDRDMLDEYGLVEIASPNNAKAKVRAQPKKAPATKSKLKARTSALDIGDTPLRLFLQASMLSTDSDQSEGQVEQPKVTIVTCHAAKGLEWPVVMIPAVEDGTFPSARAEDVNEELRLLYVACTRAQTLLYVLHSHERKVAGNAMRRDLSKFIENALMQNKHLFTDHVSNLPEGDLQLMANLINRPCPSREDVSRKIAEFIRLQKSNPGDHYIGDVAGPGAPVFPPIPLGQPPGDEVYTVPVAFTSGRALMQSGNFQGQAQAAQNAPILQPPTSRNTDFFSSPLNPYTLSSNRNDPNPVTHNKPVIARNTHSGPATNTSVASGGRSYDKTIPLSPICLNPPFNAPPRPSHNANVAPNSRKYNEPDSSPLTYNDLNSLPPGATSISSCCRSVSRSANLERQDVPLSHLGSSRGPSSMTTQGKPPSPPFISRDPECDASHLKNASPLARYGSLSSSGIQHELYAPPPDAVLSGKDVSDSTASCKPASQPLASRNTVIDVPPLHSASTEFGKNVTSVLHTCPPAYSIAGGVDVSSPQKHPSLSQVVTSGVSATPVSRKPLSRSQVSITLAQGGSITKAPKMEPSSSASSVSIGTPASLPSTPATKQIAGVKRRLGMGRTGTGYANKKFKAPALGPGL